ncbi:HAD-IA family hydrolase [candidate division WOR-3 bacterium]|nr:HAD-IA family hydrolase [candidate division WOR-3 bacterium]
MFSTVIFDLDGTILDSNYDWKKIREELELKQYSILDHLYSLPDEERKKKELLLERYERIATYNASLFPDVKEVLLALRKMNIKTGLSTNNSLENTNFIIEKHRLEFDDVVTRDNGIWKPNKEPILLLMQELHAKPQETLVVGDSDYDILSAREAGASSAILLRERILEHKPEFILKGIRDVLLLVK